MTTLYEVSNSEISVWKSCRRKWWLRYYLRLRPRKKDYVGPLPLGSRVHKALEVHYREGQDLLAVHQELVDEARMSMLADGGMDTAKLDDEAELGRLMLEGYLDWVAEEGLDSDLEVIGIEEVLKYPFPLHRGAITLIGKIDQRIVRKFSGTRAVLDFKTAQSFDVFNKTAHMSPQLKTYMLLDKMTAQEAGDERRIDGGIFRLLRKVKRGPRANPPFYQDQFVSHNDYTLRAFWTQLTGVLQELYDVKAALDAGADPMQVAHPNPTRDCTFGCEFFTICSMFDDGSNVESALDDNFETHDVYGYYGDKDPE